MSSTADTAATDAARSAEPVVRALTAFGLADSSLRLPTVALDERAWLELIDAASAERLVGLLFAATVAGAFPVAPARAEHVQQLATDATHYCMMLESELAEVTTLLDAAGVSTRVLKGPATAALDYPDPTLRPFVDIDLLGRADEFDMAVVTLVGAGYARRYPQPRPGFDRRFSKGTSFTTPAGMSIDLHRTFVMGPFGLTVHAEDLWGAGTAFSLGRRTFQALPAEARLLHACYHATLGDWPRRLLPQRDIAQILLVTGCVEGRVLELAARWHAEAVLATAITSAWNLLGLERDTELTEWARGYVPSRRERRAIGLYTRDEPNYAAMSVGALRVIRGGGNKMAFLRALAFPDRSYVAGRHESRLARIAGGVQQVLDVRRSRP